MLYFDANVFIYNTVILDDLCIGPFRMKILFVFLNICSGIMTGMTVARSSIIFSAISHACLR